MQPGSVVAREPEDEAWDASRSGARAVRGFTFQHLVGGWIAAGVHSGDVDGDQLVPEGFEDLSVEGPRTLQIQVKSRIGRRGSFSARDAARAILSAWVAHLDRGQLNEQVAIVFERDIAGCPLPGDLGTSIAALPHASTLIGELISVAEELSEAAVRELCGNVWVLALPWDAAKAQTVTRLKKKHTSTPSGVLQLVGRDLAASVQTAAAENVERSHDDRSALSRTMIASQIARTIELTDLASLEAAIRNGLCEPLDGSLPSTDGPRYYEGVSTEPSHVVSGLVIASEETNDAVLSACLEVGAVVLHGPSGVGKSAALWSLPGASPGVLWFRVRRLLPNDVSEIVRLARAWAASPQSPIGFLVDSAGTGSFEGWSDLRREARSIPGLFVVATARNEDLKILGDLSDCIVVDICLNETLASRIYEGLRDSGATTTPHWAEAYENSRGLTMEFTHILTKGDRLQRIIDDQINDRIVAGRTLELEILTLCAVAGRWGVSVPIAALTNQLDASPFEIRGAIARLAEEHMLAENSGRLAPLHLLRSVAISKSIHELPPPQLAESFARVLTILDDGDVARLVVNALSELPELAPQVIDAAFDQAANTPRFVEFLHGLRLSEFSIRLAEWDQIAETLGVVRSKRAILFQLAISGIEFPLMPDPLPQALAQMMAVPDEGLVHQLLGRMDSVSLGRLIHDSVPLGLAQLLSELRESRSEVIDSLIETVSEPQFREKIIAESLSQLSEILAASMTVSPVLAHEVSDAAGGQEHLLQRFANETAWTLEARIDQVPGGSVGFARILHHSDDDADDHAQAVAAGRRMLRLFPSIDSVDIMILLPGGHEIVVGDHNFASTGLTRENDVTEREVAWNRERIARSRLAAGESDTSRLDRADGLIKRLLEPCTSIATACVSGGLGTTDPNLLAAELQSISDEANQIGPSLGREFDEDGKLQLVDPVSGFITDLTDNLFPRLAQGEGMGLLAAHLRETILGKSLPGMKMQPWALIGLETHPKELDQIEQVLIALQVVLQEIGREPASGTAILAKARSARREWALRRGAEEAGRLSAAAREQADRQFLIALSDVEEIQTLVSRQGHNGPVTRVILYDTSSVTDWPAVLDRVVALVGSRSDVIGVDVTVIPTLEGRRLPGLEMRVFKGKPWPVAPIPEQLESDLPPAHPAPLTDRLRGAFDALIQLFALRDLPSPQLQIPAIGRVQTDATESFDVALEWFRLHDDDAVIRDLSQLLEGLRVELADPNAPNLASSITGGLFQYSGDPAAIGIAAAGLSALEWDVEHGISH
ncbi:hypothetical protein VD659_14920 [Herbiconiux sp. 11R-BC]|uniref:hypothetical protein n=1 Tax=Herbiconiux sp. 11R-BC TaxID=3111637 RepID=UPI003C103372